MFTRRSALTVVGAAILGVVLTAPVTAELTVKHTNYLTFKAAFALPGVSLTPAPTSSSALTKAWIRAWSAC
jgi:hypothetical protein